MTTLKISRLARILRVATVLGMVGLVGLVLLFVVFMPLGYYLTPPEEIEILRTPSFFVTLAMYALSTLFFIYCLEQLRKLFTAYMSGDVISANTATLIQKSGFALLWAGVVELLIPPVAALVTWLTDGPAEYADLETFTLSNAGFLFAAGMLIVIGWAMSDAAQMAEENKAFV